MTRRVFPSESTGVLEAVPDSRGTLWLANMNQGTGRLRIGNGHPRAPFATGRLRAPDHFNPDVGDNSGLRGKRSQAWILAEMANSRPRVIAESQTRKVCFLNRRGRVGAATDAK